MHQLHCTGSHIGIVIRAVDKAANFVIPDFAKSGAFRGSHLPTPGALQLRLGDDSRDARAAIGRTLFAFPYHTEDVAARVATAGTEVQPAVGTDIDVGDVEWLAFEEGFLRRSIAGSTPIHAIRVDFSLRPVAREECVVEPSRVAVVIVKNTSGR